MKTSTTTRSPLCRNRHKSDAACHLKRCKKCGHALLFVFQDRLCPACVPPTPVNGAGAEQSHAGQEAALHADLQP